MMAQIGKHRNGMTSGTTTNETYGSLSVRQMKHMEIWWKLWKYGKIRKDMETCENVWKKHEERNMYRSAHTVDGNEPKPVLIAPAEMI